MWSRKLGIKLKWEILPLTLHKRLKSTIASLKLVSFNVNYKGDLAQNQNKNVVQNAMEDKVTLKKKMWMESNPKSRLQTNMKNFNVA